MFATWKTQQASSKVIHCTASGFLLGKIPILGRISGSNETIGFPLRRLRGSRDSGKSRIADRVKGRGEKRIGQVRSRAELYERVFRCDIRTYQF